MSAVALFLGKALGSLLVMVGWFLGIGIAAFCWYWGRHLADAVWGEDEDVGGGATELDREDCERQNSGRPSHH